MNPIKETSEVGSPRRGDRPFQVGPFLRNGRSGASRSFRRSDPTFRPPRGGSPTLIVCAVVLAVSGCATKPLKGGRAITTPKPGGGLEQTIIQPDNPAQVSRHDQETIRVRTYTIPAGSRFEPYLPATNPPAPAAYRSAVPAVQALQPSAVSLQPLVLSAPMPVTEREETRARAELGAAQKDTARELGAKLASLRPLTWVGLALFLFGLATLFWPPLKVLVGSVTTSIALTLGGLVLMVVPSLVVGHELIILGGVGLAVGAWFLAHRHGQLRGVVDAVVSSSSSSSSSAITPKLPSEGGSSTPAATPTNPPVTK